MVSKIVYGFSIKSYKYFKFQKSKNLRPITHKWKKQLDN